MNRNELKVHSHKVSSIEFAIKTEDSPFAVSHLLPIIKIRCSEASEVIWVITLWGWAIQGVNIETVWIILYDIQFMPNCMPVHTWKPFLHEDRYTWRSPFLHKDHEWPYLMQLNEVDDKLATRVKQKSMSTKWALSEYQTRTKWGPNENQMSTKWGANVNQV